MTKKMTNSLMLLETRWFHENIGFFSLKNSTNMHPVGKQMVSRKKMDFEPKELVRKSRVVKTINSRKKWIDESTSK